MVYRILNCTTTCEPYNKGPFGVGEVMGTDEGCFEGQKYYGGRSNKSHYYVCKDIDKIDLPTHAQSSFLGVFESKNFEEIETVENIEDYLQKNPI